MFSSRAGRPDDPDGTRGVRVAVEIAVSGTTVVHMSRHQSPHAPGRPAGPRRPGKKKGRRQDADVELITDARRSPMDDWRHRRRLYAGLQLSRIPLIILAVVSYAWLHSPVLAAVFAVISLPLPWVAVLLANEKNPDREKGEPKVYKPAVVRHNREVAEAARLTDGGYTSRSELPADRHPVIDADADDSDDSDDRKDDDAHDR